MDEKYMKEAIRQAKKAYVLEEVPIGCVIVYQGKIIGRGYNRRTVDKNTLAHAELIPIKKASKKLKTECENYNLKIKLCEDFKNSDACLQTYSTYNAIQSNTEKNRSLVRVTLYEVLYYLDIGCKLNNYDACMIAGKIYEHGVKPGASQALYGYNIAYDAQEAKRYYKRVCRSISDKAEEACQKIEELSQTRHSLTE